MVCLGAGVGAARVEGGTWKVERRFARGSALRAASRARTSRFSRPLEKLLNYSTTLLLNCSTAQPLYYSTALLLYCSTAQLLYYSTTLLLNYFTAQLLYY